MCSCHHTAFGFSFCQPQLIEYLSSFSAKGVFKGLIILVASHKRLPHGSHQNSIWDKGDQADAGLFPPELPQKCRGCALALPAGLWEGQRSEVAVVMPVEKTGGRMSNQKKITLCRWWTIHGIKCWMKIIPEPEIDQADDVILANVLHLDWIYWILYRSREV